MSNSQQLLHFDHMYNIGEIFPGKTVKDFTGLQLRVGEIHVRDGNDVRVIRNLVTQFNPKMVMTAHGHMPVAGYVDLKVSNPRHPDLANLPDTPALEGELCSNEDGTLVLYSRNNKNLVGFKLAAMLPVDPAEEIAEARHELRRYFTPDQYDEALFRQFDNDYGLFKPEARQRIEELRKILNKVPRS